MNTGILFALVTALCFTTHEPVSKLIADQVNPYAITAIRFFISALILLPISIRGIIKDKVKLNVKEFAVLSGLGILFMASMILMQVSVKIADSPAIIAIIFSSNSIFTIILSTIVLKNKLTKLKIFGIFLCIIGVVVSADLSQGTNLTSVALSLLSAITFSVYSVLCKKYMTKVSGVIQSGISFLIGSIALIIVLLICGVDITGGVNMDTLPELMYIAVIVTGLGYWAYFIAMIKDGPQTAAVAFLIKPILTPFATFFINGIAPNSSIIIAVVLVVIGASLASGALQSIKLRKSKNNT